MDMNTHFNVRSARLPLLAALSIALLAGGCAERKKTSETPESPRPGRGAEPAQPAPAVPAVRARPPVAAPTPGKAPAPIPDRALNIRADCTSGDEAGYAEAIKLSVANGLVSEFEATITVRKRGSCRFHLADFRQTRSAPHVELVARSGSRCATRMWYQQNRFTVAFSDCPEMCTPRGTADYIWPIELRLSDGACR
jgi:hypothetical protein